jgi:hypothetical protein
MVNYRKSKLYCIKRCDTGEIIWTAGTVSDVKRRYWNHRYNHKDSLYKIIQSQNLDWNNLKIELLAEFASCKDRTMLRFASEVIYIYSIHNNSPVLHHFLQNIDNLIQ